jgi:hypothetical protein
MALGLDSSVAMPEEAVLLNSLTVLELFLLRS